MAPHSTTDREVQRRLPLKPVDFLVLLVLERGDRHGYGIVQDIESHTEGRIRLVPGNLYAVLRRLLNEGLLTEARRQLRGDGDQRRRHYTITALGAGVLSAEAERLRDLVAVAENRNIIDSRRPA